MKTDHVATYSTIMSPIASNWVQRFAIPQSSGYDYLTPMSNWHP
jgi:hypothetical protein